MILVFYSFERFYLIYLGSYIQYGRKSFHKLVYDVRKPNYRRISNKKDIELMGSNEIKLKHNVMEIFKFLVKKRIIHYYLIVVISSFLIHRFTLKKNNLKKKIIETCIAIPHHFTIIKWGFYCLAMLVLISIIVNFFLFFIDRCTNKLGVLLKSFGFWSSWLIKTILV